jgi:Aspartyl protease
MAWRSYPYLVQTDRKNPGSYTYRPSLNVEVSGPTDSGIFTGLVDSGTEITMIDSQVAEFLGIDRTKCRPATASGVGGTRPAFIAQVSLKIEKFNEVLTCGVLFVDNLDFDLILGQQDFFNRFLVKFEKAKNRFYLDVAR